MVWALAGQELRPADADGEVEEMEWRGEELATGPPPIQETIWGWVLEWELGTDEGWLRLLQLPQPRSAKAQYGDPELRGSEKPDRSR